MIDFLSQYKQTIDQVLHNFLRKKKQELSKVNPWGNDAIMRLADFVVRGKTIRGSLAIFSYHMFKNDTPKELVETAAALELFHSAFLIHDDIADRDTRRRGADSLYHQYQKQTKDNHKGISLAIHAADLALFLGFQLTSDTAKTIVSKELANVCVAQMQDITQTFSDDEASILHMYRYKTARYTFSLPLAVGATLAHAKTATTASLVHLGENLGILYQIRDDQLDGEKKHRLEKMVKKLYEGVRVQITALPLGEKYKQSLLELARFCMIRQK